LKLRYDPRNFFHLNRDIDIKTGLKAGVIGETVSHVR
jgi:hypothetical protein